MLFASLEFLLLFLPIVVIIYFIVPKKIKNMWLLLSSLFFYAWGEPSFVIIMVCSIIVNYIMALIIDKKRNCRIIITVLLLITIILNIGVLFIYKYLNFVTSIIHSFNAYIEVTTYVLPIGISFYTFQAISYVIDIYRGEKAQRSIINVGLYISFFPQLIAGPIVRYGDIKNQLVNRKVTLQCFSEGILKFLIGFNKKVLIANILANVADVTFESVHNTVLMAWIGAICYTFQIYFDFSGYSDMAIGLGRLFGFELPKNFNYPYASKTITDFWRRWHISLGYWFRDYVYFPLGGSKVSSKARLVFNLMLVWLLTGIWHGANYTFIAWGILYGILISVEKIFKIPNHVKNHKYMAIPYQVFVILVVIIGWIVFRSDSFGIALNYIQDLFGLRNVGVVQLHDVFLLKEYVLFIIIGVVLSIPVVKTIKSKFIGKVSALANIWTVGEYVINIGLFLVGLSYLVITAHNPFIYFNF